MVQVSQGFSVLAVHRIMHNDAHFRNVRIEEFKTLQKISYVFPKKVTLYTKFVVTIFDFDRSYQKGGTVNTGLDTYGFCENLGECNSYVAKFDWYTVLAHLLSATEDNTSVQEERKEFEMILGKLYDKRDKLRVGGDAFFGLPCTCKKINKKKDVCLECSQKSLHSLITPRTYFLHNINSLRIK